MILNDPILLTVQYNTRYNTSVQYKFNIPFNFYLHKCPPTSTLQDVSGKPFVKQLQAEVTSDCIQIDD